MGNQFTFLRNLLFILLTAFPLGAVARVVDADRAARVAAAFLRLSQTRGESSLHPVWNSGDRGDGTRAGEEALYYVFERGEGRGFVVVAGDDRVRPVLAYSSQGAAPRPGNLPGGLVWWLDFVSAQIRRARQSGVEDAGVARQWAQTEMGRVEVQLQTAEWNQGFPFNRQCPAVGSEHCLTGCGPTAAAIIMRYHQWPAKGRGVAEAYTTEKGMTVPARDLDHAYDWSHMPMGGSGYVEVEAEAVSTLMADIGHAIGADYGLRETSAFVNPQILAEHFDYHPGIYWTWRRNFTEDRWLGMLKNELDAGCPVLYSGQGTPFGHYFVFDGYAEGDYFHVNWGWGGYCNGFFTISAMNPQNGYSFNEDQYAIFGFRPNDGSEPEDWLCISDDTDVQLDEEVEQGKPFSFCSFYFYNRTQLLFEGLLRVVLVNREGKPKEVVSPEYPCVAQADSYSSISDWRTCTINGPIDFGDRLHFYYKSKNSDEWHLIRPLNDQVTNWEIPVADESDIAGSTSFTFDRLHRTITLSTKKGVAARLFSESGEDLSPHLSIEGTTIRIPVRGLPAGRCTVRLTKGADTKELSFSVKPYTR